MAINNLHNLSFFDMKMFEKLSYNQLCRNLIKCRDSITILNILQDLLEYSDNSVFNDIIVYDRLAVCLNSTSNNIKKKALLVLYRCLILIEDGNTNNLADCIFNNIISCAFSDSLDMKRISLQCLNIIISDLSIDEFVCYLIGACEMYLRRENRTIYQKFSFIIREIFAKLPRHLNRKVIMESILINIDNEDDFYKKIYDFLNINTSCKMEFANKIYAQDPTVLKSDLFPKRFLRIEENDNNKRYISTSMMNQSKIKKYENENFDGTMNTLSTISGCPNIYRNVQSSYNTFKENDDDLVRIGTETNSRRNNLSCKIIRKFPIEFFKTSSKNNTQEISSQTSKQMWSNDIYRRSSDQPVLDNETVPSYFLDSIRKSASKKREALFKSFNYTNSQSFNESPSKEQPMKYSKYIIEDHLPKIINNNNNSNKDLFMKSRTVSYPCLMKIKSKKLVRNLSSKPEIKTNLSKIKNDQAKIDEITSMLINDDWNKNCEGLLAIQQLVLSEQSDLLDSNQIRSLCSLIFECTKNLRSQVSRMGIQTLDTIIQSLGHKLDFVADLISEIIIGKAGEINRFIRDDLNRTMKSYLVSISLERSLMSLSRMALNHRNGNIRKIFAENLDWLCRDNLELFDKNEKLQTKLVESLIQLSKDPNEETRYYAKEAIKRIPKEWFGTDDF